MPPTFSIIIPTSNSGNTLENCLRSIISQNFESYEVLIIDGESTDHTIDTIKHFAGLNSRIRFISEKDEGLYEAMNKGIKMAKGKWLYFLGSDDYLFNADALNEISVHLQPELDLIYGNTVWVPEDLVDRGVKELKHLLYAGINHQRIFYKREVFEKNGYYKENYKVASDLEFNIRLFCDQKISKKYVDIPISYYYTGGRSFNKIDEEFWADWKTIIYRNFAPHLRKKIIFERLNWYCWHLLHRKEYGRSLALFCQIFFATFSTSFLKHSLSQGLKIFKSGKTRAEYV